MILPPITHDKRTTRYVYITTIKIHHSCGIEDFVETHLCKLCVKPIPITRNTVCVLNKDIDRRLPLELDCTSVNRVTLINLCTYTTINFFFEGDKIWRLWNAPVYHVYPVVVWPVRGVRGGVDGGEGG